MQKTTQNKNTPDTTTEIKSDKKSGQKFKIKSWYSNRYQIVVVQRNILLFLAALLMVAMTVSIIFVKVVVSSKSLEPYVIEVEEKSGIPTIVDQITSQALTADESIKKYFINQFIQAAAAYNPRTYDKDREIVRLLSTVEVYNNFKTRINPKELGTDSKIEIKPISIKFLGPVNVQVRVLRTLTGAVAEEKNYVIDMVFDYPNLTLTAEERLLNPLNFQVKSFAITEEISN